MTLALQIPMVFYFVIEKLGFGNSNRIVSFSNDGKCIIWRDDDLTIPDSTIQLKFRQESSRTSEKDLSEFPLAPMFVKLDGDDVLVGTFDKLWHRFNIKEFFKGNEFLAESEYFVGHEAPVCSISRLKMK